MTKIDSYKYVQSIAKQTMNYLSSIIVPGITEEEIKKIAEKYMLDNGIETFWYYDVGAFVFVGNRTTLSISGRNYKPSKQKVVDSDIVTVDLSPCIGNLWGDYSRTFIIGQNDFSHGVDFETHLHHYLVEIITPEMTFDELYCKINAEIEGNGYKNVDFNLNLGHTIEILKEDRKYLEKNNQVRFKDIDLFTFEPHIQRKDQSYGFKMENIYYFENNKLQEL